jgi:hypothetical protein
MESAAWMRASLMVVSAAVTAMTPGCSPEPLAIAALITDEVYTVTPASVKAKAQFVTGEAMEMKVMERIEEGSGHVASPARLTAKLVLRNDSADQIVHLIAANIRYLDAQGRPIKLQDNRTEPTIRASDRLDPGQEVNRTLDVEFPAGALKANQSKRFRLELWYVASRLQDGNYPSEDEREETLNFEISIGESVR